MGPAGMNLFSDLKDIDSIADFGVLFLLFEQGLELIVDRLKKLVQVCIRHALHRQSFSSFPLSAVYSFWKSSWVQPYRSWVMNELTSAHAQLTLLGTMKISNLRNMLDRNAKICTNMHLNRRIAFKLDFAPLTIIVIYLYKLSVSRYRILSSQNLLYCCFGHRPGFALLRAFRKAL